MIETPKYYKYKLFDKKSVGFQNIDFKKIVIPFNQIFSFPKDNEREELTFKNSCKEIIEILKEEIQ